MESSGIDNEEQKQSVKAEDLHNHFECKICLEIPKEPIATLCGHLYCWTCIYEWAKSKQSQSIPCPSCNSEVVIDKVIPLYTSAENHGKREKNIPKRPQPEANPFRAQNNNPFGFNMNPFGLNFGFINMGGGGNPNPVGRGYMAIFPILFILFFPTLLELFMDILDLAVQIFFNSTGNTDNPGARINLLPNGEIIVNGFYFDVEDIVLALIMAICGLVTTIYIFYRLFKRHRNRQ